MSLHWPYPRWIAHRGAGKLAPENTLAAFKLGAQHGYRMFECDVKLSADHQVFLLHDDTLERTTNGHGLAGDLDWHTLRQLDAGRWHSAPFAGEPLPLLSEIAAFCLSNNYFLNIEIKPSPKLERLTGECVARLAQQLWLGQATPPLLTSFKSESLEGARSVAPELPRGLLVDAWHDDVFRLTDALACQALVCHHRLWTRERVAQAHHLKLTCLSYTVNQAREVSRLNEIGADVVITDEVHVFEPIDR